MSLIERLRSPERATEPYQSLGELCIEAAAELEANAAEIGQLREELRAAQIAFKRIEQDYRTPAKMREIAGARAYNASELLGCLKHGAPFISPGLCAFCDEDARAALNKQESGNV